VRLACATKMLLMTWAASLLFTLAAAHPANIPVARAKVQVDGKIDLSFTFNILAFILDQTPELVLDAPMNALLDGPKADLQARLDAAKKRFVDGLAIGGAERSGVIDLVDFPTATEVLQVANSGQAARLPVMMTTILHCHLKPGVRNVSFRFADVLGPTVLSTEFPYQEPVSESIEAGDWSQSLPIPTQSDVDRIAASLKPHKLESKARGKPPTEADAKAAIQKQYNAWSKAYMAHDIDTLFGILASGYSLKTAKGAIINHDEYEVMLKLRKQKHSDTTRYSTEIVRITLTDGVAAVWSRETTTDPGLDQKTGKATPVSYQHDYVDLWIYSGGKWLIKSTVTQKEQLLPQSRPPN